MKLRNLILLLLLASVLCTGVLASEAPEQWEGKTFLYDEADILEESEEAKINSRLAELSEGVSTELFAVTLEQYGNATEDQAAACFRERSSTGNGVILVLTFSEYGNSYYIYAQGEAWSIFNDRALDKVEDACVPFLRDGEYPKALLAYGEACEDVISSHGRLPAGGIVLCIVIGALLSFLIPMNILKRQLKTVRSQPAASSYVKQDSLVLTVDRDTFLYRNVSRVAKPQNNSNGSRGGGSSGGGGGRGGSF